MLHMFQLDWLVWTQSQFSSAIGTLHKCLDECDDREILKHVHHISVHHTAYQVDGTCICSDGDAKSWICSLIRLIGKCYTLHVYSRSRRAAQRFVTCANPRCQERALKSHLHLLWPVETTTGKLARPKKISSRPSTTSDLHQTPNVLREPPKAAKSKRQIQIIVSRHSHGSPKTGQVQIHIFQGQS